MAENVKTIQLRLDTVNQVSKITNAMNLVSMSKLQKYQRQMQELADITEDFERMETETFEDSKDLPILGICIASDLGLASLYNRTMQKAAQELDYVYWIGTQGFDRMKKNANVEVVNDLRSSDSLYIEEFYDDLVELMRDYRIIIAVPKMSGNAVEIHWRKLNQQLLRTDMVVYEPSYEVANQRFQEFYLFMTLYEAYYQSKFSENMSRRIAMEQATDNANEMREELRNRYNQLRQEEITQEILELSAGVE
jgi:F-type H+-transporting ATPase subunit gamma